MNDLLSENIGSGNFAAAPDHSAAVGDFARRVAADGIGNRMKKPRFLFFERETDRPAVDFFPGNAKE